MKILLFGAGGQVGWQLQRSLSTLGEVVALDFDSIALCGDLAQPARLAATVRTVRPSVIVNAAAYTAVDRAEDEPDIAHAINAAACEVLANEAHQLGAWLVHYSTDYVYAGTGDRPWLETDACEPISVYGASKLAGDLAVQRECARHLIFRTSWVYDSWGQNFLKTILRAAATRESLKVVSDQWGAPTRAALLADITAHALRAVTGKPAADELAGVYHAAPSGYTSWHQYATLAIEHARACGAQLRVAPDQVHAIATAQYPTRARRPSNSRLDTTRLQDTFKLVLPSWETGVRSVVAELVANRCVF